MHLIRFADTQVADSPLESRRYYLPDRDPIEVIETVIQPSASQPAHAHETIREAMLVVEGEVFAGEVVAGKSLGHTLRKGDFAVFDAGALHFMENQSTSTSRTLHFKFLGTRKDRELFLTDKSGSSVATNLDNSPITAAERFSSYVETHNTLDKILWQIPAFLVAVTAFGFGLLGVFLPAKEAELPPFNHNQTLGLFLVAWGLMYIVGVYAMHRLRIHHTMVAHNLQALDPKGYFGQRSIVASSSWPPPAPRIVTGVFLALGLVFWVWGIAVYGI